eukprot:280803-Chlamydomonas_euryale.AAC.1
MSPSDTPRASAPDSPRICGWRQSAVFGNAVERLGTVGSSWKRLGAVGRRKKSGGGGASVVQGHRRISGARTKKKGSGQKRG